MRLAVLGNSASGGRGLPGGERAWPWLAADGLASETGDAVEVQHRFFMPTGPEAAESALGALREAHPDVVLVAVGSYACAVGTVAEQVRRRWGRRAYRVAARVERAVEARTGGDQPPLLRRLNLLARRVARRLVGTAPLCTPADVLSAYAVLLRGLAGDESLQVMVVPEPEWQRSVVRDNPGADVVFARLRAEVRAIAAAHRLPWVDPGLDYAAAPDRDALYLPDGVHRTPEGHRVQAQAVLRGLIGLAGTDRGDGTPPTGNAPGARPTD